MTTKIKLPVTASAKVVSNPIVRQNNTVVYGGPVGGTATAGTISILAKAPDAVAFETPKDDDGVDLNTINIASPEKLNIPGKIQEYQVSVAGFAGTATEIFFVVDSTG